MSIVVGKLVVRAGPQDLRRGERRSLGGTSTSRQVPDASMPSRPTAGQGAMWPRLLCSDVSLVPYRSRDGELRTPREEDHNLAVPTRSL